MFISLFVCLCACVLSFLCCDLFTRALLSLRSRLRGPGVQGLCSSLKGGGSKRLLLGWTGGGGRLWELLVTGSP